MAPCSTAVVSYDRLGRLSSVAHRNQSCTSWPGDNADSLDADLGWRYTCASPGSTESFTYDSVGNRTSQGGTYDAGNRITALGVFTFEYDADGNITRRYNTSTSQDRRYYWSAENLLDSVVTVGADKVAFQYNALGQPVVRSRNGTVERYYAWDGGNLVLELDASFNRVAEYVYLGIDAPLALITGSTTPSTVEYHQQDELGNVIGVNSGNSVSQTVTYDTWGKPTITGSAPNRLLWKGLLYEADGVDLYYMRARWYDPEIGRFISEDPIGLSGGINQYAFAADDPLNGWDPNGMFPPRQLARVHVRARGPDYDAIRRFWRSLVDAARESSKDAEGPRWEPDGDVGDQAVQACQKMIAAATGSLVLDLTGLNSLRRAVGVLRKAKQTAQFSRSFHLPIPNVIKAANERTLRNASANVGRIYGASEAQGLAYSFGTETLIGQGYDVINYIPITGISTINTGVSAYDLCFNPGGDS